jgi:hypothetical protein
MSSVPEMTSDDTPDGRDGGHSVLLAGGTPIPARCRSTGARHPAGPADPADRYEGHQDDVLPSS